MNRKWQKTGCWCVLFVGLFWLGACSPTGSIYLQPGKGGQEPPVSTVRPVVQLELFEEKFDTGEVIGGHFFRAERQLLKVEEQEVARTLRRMIAQRLAEKNIPFTYGDEWNRTLVGLERIEPPVQVVVDGRISRLWLEVKSGLTHTNYQIDLEIACRLGVVPKEEVVSRTVHVSEEMIKFSSQPAVMEELVNKSLAEAAGQIVLKITESI